MTTQSHGRAALGMVGVALLWSSAGVVTRQLETAASFELTFLRSLFCFATLAVVLSASRGAALWRGLARPDAAIWLSGACWAVMFTAFMVALTMTRVANVLVTMASGPLLTALCARVALGHRLAPRTWGAIVVGAVGIAWMFGRGFAASDARSVAGMAVAFAVPVATAVNYTVLQHAGRRAGAAPDMPLAVLIGAALSALATAPLAWPLRATPHDLALLAGLGIFQLALPCLALVRVARVLPAPEVALLGLLEEIFGVLWAWLGAGEAPGSGALVGGALVVGALGVDQALALRSRELARPDHGVADGQGGAWP